MCESVHGLPHHWWYLYVIFRSTHMYACEWTSATAQPHCKPAIQVLKKIGRVCICIHNNNSKALRVWSTKKSTQFQVCHVPHHWHITTMRIRRPNICWKWIQHTSHNLLNHIRNTRNEDENRFAASLKVFYSGNRQHMLYTFRSIASHRLALLWFDKHVGLCCLALSAIGSLIFFVYRKCKWKHFLDRLLFGKNENETKRAQA